MKKHLIKSTLVVAAMTTISRIFGLIRDVFAEGGFSQAFVPVLSEYREQRSEEEVQALIDQTTATLGLAVLITTVIGIIIAPVVVSIFALGWTFNHDQGKFTLAVEMLRITFPYLVFISLTALAGGIFNTYRKFAVPAFTPVLLNLSLIACAIWLAPGFPPEKRIVALAWGVCIAGAVQLLFQLPFLRQLRVIPVPRFGRDPEGVRAYGVSSNCCCPCCLRYPLPRSTCWWIHSSPRSWSPAVSPGCITPTA